MNFLFKLSILFILIYAYTFGGVSAADDRNSSKIISEINHLQLTYVSNQNNLVSDNESLNSPNSFLLSREIAKNQIIGVNYGGQEIDNDLFSDGQSKLWVSLQLAF